MSVPWWRLAERPEPVETDLAIVGGGIAGLSALRRSAELGVSSVLLERGRVCDGASGRNAGYLMRGAADSYAAACESIGRDAARTLWRASERNLDRLLGWGAGETRGFDRRASCLLAASEAEASLLSASVEMLREDGFAVGVFEADAAGDVLGDRLRRGLVGCLSGGGGVGLINPGDAVCSPVEVVRRVAAPVRGRVREGEGVVSIEREGEEVRVRSAGLLVTARAALVCTNAWAGELLPELRGCVVPNRGQMLVVDARPIADGACGALSMAYYLDRGADYIREVGGGMVAVGGRRCVFESEERTASDEPSEGVQRELEGLVADVFGRRLPVVHRWAGVMGFTGTGLPFAGPVSGADGDRIWAVAGFTGHGMSLGAEVACAAVEALTRTDSRGGLDGDDRQGGNGLAGSGVLGILRGANHGV